MSDGGLKITANGEREIVMTRAFRAPRVLVWDALTKPELVKRWLRGLDGWSMPVCEIDFRVGGKYRYVWRHDAQGTEMGMGGVFREITPPERVVATEKFDQAWYPGGAVSTFVLSEEAGVTLVTQTMLYDSREARDAVMRSPMESGVKVSYDRLEKLVTSPGAAGAEKGASAS
jgi:uncharacterized protein YndB with AHSA1/START domain